MLLLVDKKNTIKKENNMQNEFRDIYESILQYLKAQQELTAEQIEYLKKKLKDYDNS